MIIDTTYSAMEDMMSRMRLLEAPTFRKSRSKKRNNKAVVRSFLLAKGQDPGEHFNYIAFWKGKKLIDAHFVCEAVKEEPEEKLEADFKKLLDKFENFMRFAKLSTQNSPKLSR